MLVDAEDGDLENGHDEELHRTGFTQDSTKRDQDCGCAEVCVDYSAGGGGGQETIRKTDENTSVVFTLMHSL